MNLTKIDTFLDRFTFGAVVLLAVSLVSCVVFLFLLLLGLLPWYIVIPLLIWASWYVGGVQEKYKEFKNEE